MEVSDSSFGEVLVVDLPVEISLAQLWRFMGQGPAKSQLNAVPVQEDPQWIAKITEISKRGQRLIKPRGTYRLLPVSQLCAQIDTDCPDNLKPGLRSLPPNDCIVIALTTLGLAYDQWLEQLAGEGIMAQWIGEAIGNCALFTAGTFLKRHVNQQLQLQQQKIGQTWAPGDAHWPFALQKPILNMLDPAPLGVTINDHLVLLPLKTTTQVFHVVSHNQQENSSQPCRLCHNHTCLFRRES
jgi:hypothetical protein